MIRKGHRAQITTMKGTGAGKSRAMLFSIARTLRCLRSITESASNGALTGTSRIKDVGREVPHFRRSCLRFPRPRIQKLEIQLQQWASAQFSCGYCLVSLLHCDLPVDERI